MDPTARSTEHSTAHADHPPARFRALAFSGSLRRGSSNTALVRLAQRLAPQHTPDLHVEIVDWIDQLPWMNPDLEDDLPEIVERWRQMVRDADALIVGLPEYNYGPAPLAKNAIDWITRPPHDRAIAGKVVALLSSAGRSGGANAQQGFSTILPFLGAIVVTDPPVQLSLVAEHLDADGNSAASSGDHSVADTVSEAVRAKLAAVVHALEQRDASD